MPIVEWVGQSLRDDDNSQANTSRLLNIYRERHGQKFVLKSVLGMTSLVNLDGVFMRAMNDIGGTLYAVIGGAVYSITEAGLATNVATVTDAMNTTIEGNNGAVTIAAGGTYYNIDSGGTVTTPTTGAFSNVGSLTFIGQRTVITENGGRRFSWSDAADSTTFNALNFATAETEDDDILRGMAIGPQFWIFSERSIERWYQSGSSDESEFLLPVSGAAIDTGLKAFGLLTRIPNGAFFVGDDNIVYLISGGAMQPISTRGVETAIVQSTPNACFFYEDEGHKFCVLQFTDRPAWCFDVSSNEWHERSETGQFTTWTATASAKAYGKHYIGTDAGAVAVLGATYQDFGSTLWRRAISTTLENDGNRFTIDRVQLQPLAGESTTSGRSPQIVVQFSKDRAKTFGRERILNVGALGDYDKLTTINALGQFRRATMQVTVTDPVDIPMESTAFLGVR